MTIKRLENDAYELVGQYYDFHVRQEGRSWNVDIFKKLEKNRDKAHLTSEVVGKLEDALDYCFEYDS